MLLLNIKYNIMKKYFFLVLLMFIYGPVSSATDVVKTPSAPIASELLPAPQWNDLNPMEKEALSPLSEHFNTLTAQQRRKWRVLAQKSPEWTPAKKANIQSRMLMWARMSAEQRASARQQALATKNLPHHLLRADSWNKWQDLPDDEKSNLHQKALNAPSSAH